MRHIVEFRTPQHPSFGKNNWGGASPLLARNIPHETLELRYLKLNTTRTRDEIFPLQEDEVDDNYYLPISYTTQLQQHFKKTKYVERNSFLSKLSLPWKGKRETLLGSNSRKKWFKKWDYQNRWPQGWC
ncbi:hypothetical protein Csa_009875 [Cucumis sativus]|uniref:Uncharacterized protein n=1 Tax=Cucumis sativus TaxID=3659 RepID=A0A0A0LCZ1_CUCSA|nr:hypothetical protein Csa_009875 [Cucumis sativus]